MNNDHRSAQAALKAEKARVKAMRPWYRKKRVIVPAALAVLIVIGAASGSGSDGDDAVAVDTAATEDTAVEETTTTGVRTMSGNTEFPPPADVTVTACEVENDFMSTATAKLTILNHSPKTSNYSIEVSFETPEGVQLDTGYAMANSVDSQQTSLVEAGALLDEPVEAIVCQIEEVDRYAS